MKKKLFKKVILVFILVITMALMTNHQNLTVKASENVLFSEDFESELPEDYRDYFTVENGVGVIKADAHTFNFSQVESNNYSLEFDMKLKYTSTLYVHFVGLNGNDNTNIYLKEEAAGEYWSMNDFTGHSVYNNSGDLHGGLDYRKVDLINEFAKVRFVHFEGYVELWLNGTRRAVTHLSNFGNNNYSTRTTIEEGTITSIMLHAEQPDAVMIDNLVIKEAPYEETTYSITNEYVQPDSAIMLPISAQNLYQDNFKVETTWRVLDTTKTNYYPTIKLMGLNASLTSQNQREYAVNIQGYADRTYLTPQVMAQIEGDNPWTGPSGSAYDFNGLETITYRVEVYGDNIDFYFNDQLAIQTTFTLMGIKKGHLQYIVIRSNNGGVAWEDFKYTGFDKTTGLEITSDKERIRLGDTVTLKASVFGEKTNDYNWYVDNELVENSDTTLALNNLTAGTHHIVYKNESVTSNEVSVEVIENLITISADKDTIYPIDTVTITADLQGDFTGMTLNWYVNDEPQTETSTTLNLTNLAVGNYEIKYAGDGITSNVVSVTVVAGTLEIVASKNTCLLGETIEISSIKKGISTDTVVTWYINGQETENSGDALTIDSTAYLGGDQIIIKAVSADSTESNELIITFAYDVLEKLKGDEQFKPINEIEIVEGNEYGNLTVGSDENGTYLYSEVTTGQNYWALTGNMPTSVQYMMEYKLFVPEDYNQTAYVYPCGRGLNALSPDSWIEIALNVNADGISPYVKDQSTGKTYSLDEYGFGKNLAYGEGITVKGDYNTVAFVADGYNLSFYINSELVLFYVLKSATLPSEFTFNMYPDGGNGNIPLRIKDYKFYGIVEKAPDLASVSISVSKIKAEVNENIIFAATINPFNATYEQISWYVNGEKVTGSELTYTFTAEKEGTYRVYCEIDGIKSAEKNITILKATIDPTNPTEPTENKGCSCNSATILLTLSMLMTISVAVTIIRRKH